MAERRPTQPSLLRLLVVAVALLPAWTASAAEPDGAAVPLTLAEARRAAAEQNPDVLAARAAAEARELAAEAASRSWWPRLRLTSDWMRSDLPAAVFANKLNSGRFDEADFAIDRLNAPDALSHLTTALELEVPIDAAGRTGLHTRAERERARAERALARGAAADVDLMVVRAYRQAAVARSAERVAERALETARARESEMEERVEQGVALDAMLLRVRARRRQREAELAERRADADVLERSLGVLTGAPPGTRYRAAEAPGDPAPLGGAEAEWVAAALERRAALDAAASRRRASEAEVELAGRAWFPDLAVVARVQDDRNGLGDARSGLLGVGLRWSVFDATRGRREAAARAAERAAAEQLRAAEQRVRLEVASAWRRAQASRERLAAARGGAEEGREALRVVQERRRQGLATLTDELETEVASVAAELEELQAAALVALADAELERAAGGALDAVAHRRNP